MTLSQLTLELQYQPSWSAKDFFVGTGNQEAYEWINRWPQWPAACTLIFGPQGVGKTHLVQMWQQKVNAFILHPQHFKKYLPADLVSVSDTFIWDDVELDGIEEPFFHFWNYIYQQKKYILLSHKESPYFWSITLSDLGSRILGAPAIKIQHPDDDVLGAILQKQLQDYHIAVDEAVIQYLLKRISRSAQAVHLLAEQLSQRVNQTHRRLTIALARTLLENF